jgi:hypothetical protein
MKWNGRNYRPPGYGIKVYPPKQDSIKELLKPLGEKERKGNVWIPVLNQPINVLKENGTPTPPSSPSPTPTSTLTPTPTPSSSAIPASPSPTPTQTGTPTPSPTPSNLPVTVTYRTSTSSTSNSNSYTFSSIDFGTTGLVVVVVGVENDNTSNISSVTIDGNSASQAIVSTNSTGSRQQQAIYYAVVTNTTGDIAISCSNTQLNCAIGVWTITNYTSTTPIDTKGGTSNSASMGLTTSSLPAGAVGIVGWGNQTYDGRGVGWVNATERYDKDISTEAEYSGADFTTTVSGTRTITITIPQALGGSAFNLAVWN